MIYLYLGQNVFSKEKWLSDVYLEASILDFKMNMTQNHQRTLNPISLGAITIHIEISFDKLIGVVN